MVPLMLCEVKLSQFYFVMKYFREKSNISKISNYFKDIEIFQRGVENISNISNISKISNISERSGKIRREES